MPKLTATPEMKQAAIADEPKQHENPYGYRYVERTYYPYMNCGVQDGILKAAFYLPEHLRLDGNNPAYEAVSYTHLDVYKRTLKGTYCHALSKFALHWHYPRKKACGAHRSKAGTFHGNPSQRDRQTQHASG